jgi:hypothetical protein
MTTMTNDQLIEKYRVVQAALPGHLWAYERMNGLQISPAKLVPRGLIQYIPKNPDKITPDQVDELFKSGGGFPVQFMPLFLGRAVPLDSGLEALTAIDTLTDAGDEYIPKEVVSLDDCVAQLRDHWHGEMRHLKILCPTGWHSIYRWIHHSTQFVLGQETNTAGFEWELDTQLPAVIMRVHGFESRFRLMNMHQ